MADVQLTDGFARIALPIIDALCRTKLAPLESQVVWFIIRMTWGERFKDKAGEWQSCKMAGLKLEDFAAATGLESNRLCEAIGRLEARKILTRTGSGRVRFYAIQKDYELWLGPDEMEAKPKRPYTRKNSGNPESKIPEKRNKSGVKIPEKRNENSGNPEYKFRKSGMTATDTAYIGDIESTESTAHAPDGADLGADAPLPLLPEDQSAVTAITEPDPPAKRTQEDIARDLFALWKELLIHPRMQYTKEDGKLVKARLRELVKGYQDENPDLADDEALALAEAYCRDAVIGMSRSPHNVGQNDRQTAYDEFHRIFVDKKSLDRYLKFRDRPEIDIRALRALQKSGFGEKGVNTGLNMMNVLRRMKEGQS